MSCPYSHITKPFGHFFAHATGEPKGREKVDWRTVCLALNLNPPFANREKLRKRLKIGVMQKTAKALTIDVLEGPKPRGPSVTLKAGILDHGFGVAPPKWPEEVKDAFRARLDSPGTAARIQQLPLPYEAACALFDGKRWNLRKVDPCEDAMLHAWLAGVPEETLFEVFGFNPPPGGGAEITSREKLYGHLASAIRGYMKNKRFQLWALGTDLAVACRSKAMFRDEKAYREGTTLEDEGFIGKVWEHMAIQTQLKTGVAIQSRQRPLYIPDAVFFDSLLKLIWEKSSDDSAKWLAVNRALFKKTMEERGLNLPAWYEGPMYHSVRDTRKKRGGSNERKAPQQTP